MTEYAAIDLGASSGRVVLGSFDGRRIELHELHRFPNRPVRLPDGLHWNLLHLFSEAVVALRGRSLGKLGDTRYWFNWRGERIFKVVSFYLVRYQGGRLGDIPEPFRHEVAEARWLPLEDARRLLAYGGEREMAGKALAALAGQDV